MPDSWWRLCFQDNDECLLLKWQLLLYSGVNHLFPDHRSPSVPGERTNMGGCSQRVFPPGHEPRLYERGYQWSGQARCITPGCIVNSCQATGFSYKQIAAAVVRSEERRVGQECVSTCRSRCSP